MRRLADAVRPHPHRGDVVAAGAVVLALGLIVADLRLVDAWAAGVRLAVLSAPGALLVLAMAALARVGEDAGAAGSPEGAPPVPGSTDGGRGGPRPYVTILLVGGLALALLALSDLADALGDDGRLASPAATAFAVGVLTALAVTLAATKRSALVTLVACVAGLVTLLALADLLFLLDDRLEAFRYLLLAGLICLVVAATVTRDAHRRQAVAFVNAGGVALAGLAATLAAERIPALAPIGPLAEGTPWAWELVVLLGGWALLAYAAVDREPGPAYLGALVLALFAGLTVDGDGGPSLLWWPVVLVVIGLAVVACGLRPREELAPD
ncbi:MAG TPA: hypothetical protein VGV36_08065, partial [Solirubrobacteraceae bacterium]|nr:hypothetical protein [Solirubrobacteraceae bacterium]